MNTLQTQWEQLTFIYKSGRPLLSFIAGFAAGASLYKGSELGLITATAAFVAMTLVTMVAFIANDTYDKVKDQAANLPRPIPKGLLSAKNAKMACAIMLALSILIASLINLKAVAYLSLIIVAVLAYSPVARYAGWIKGVYSATLIISPFWFVSMSADIKLPMTIMITLFLFAVFRELAGDAKDFERDAAVNQTTFAHYLGKEPALTIGCIGMLFSVAYSISLFKEPVATLIMVLSLGIQIWATLIAHRNLDDALAITRYVFLGGVIALTLCV